MGYLHPYAKIYSGTLKRQFSKWVSGIETGFLLGGVVFNDR